ncbi:MAG: hypothetical protein ACLTDR_04760 [Adlercreutzia equolifaciens]
MAAGTHRRSALVDEEQGGGSSPFQQKEMHVVPRRPRVRNRENRRRRRGRRTSRSHGGPLQTSRSAPGRAGCADEHRRRLTQPVGHCSRFSQLLQPATDVAGCLPIGAARSPNCRSASSSAVRRPRRAPKRAVGVPPPCSKSATAAPAHHRQQKARAILFRRLRRRESLPDTFGIG